MPENTVRLTARQLTEWREATWLAQDKRCALTGYTISASEAVADHCHKTGHLRGVLHAGVNSLLGKIENALPRFGVSLPRLHAMAPRIAEYRSADYSANPLYPTDRTPEEKEARANKLARKRRAAKKEMSNEG
jgi:hypothetical protein